MEERNPGRKVSIDIVKANVFAIALFLGSGVFFLLLFFLIWHDRRPFAELMGNGVSWAVFFVTMVAGIALHELIHGLTWACYAPKGWRSISFGVMWKLLTPYCHCDDPLPIRAYMTGAMMPCVTMGLLPCIVALFIGSLPVLAWGIFFISAAAGDIWMTWLLTKEPRDAMVLDHPTEAGFYILPNDR